MKLFNKLSAISLVLFLLFFGQFLSADAQAYSTAGFFSIKEAGRSVYSFNPGWKFYKGSRTDAPYKNDYDDQQWQTVALPHGLELLPEEASGGTNYQGEAWYRKRFSIAPSMENKKIFLYFEAIMGKSKIWINGKPVASHYGGYLPLSIDATPYLNKQGENVIVVLADNRDDSSFPPGKSQMSLDFAYFGGIYRDCWLISHDYVHITDPVFENEIAGGGLFVHSDKVSEKSALMGLKVQIRNEKEKRFSGKVAYTLIDPKGKKVNEINKVFSISANKVRTLASTIHVNQPFLWSPESPYLYQLEVRVKNKQGKTIDGYMKKIGIRSFEMRGYKGFYLNGKHYDQKLIGGNRHQDFAVIGNAVPNNLQWKDAVKLREANMKIIRCAHYPQDPAFMDACDALGLLVIDATPGWQFWNDDPIFEKRVFSDLRKMVRRDRNHASIFFWEPILNETRFPREFALKARKIIKEESPYDGTNYCAMDKRSDGHEVYTINYSTPMDKRLTGEKFLSLEQDSTKVYFQREWGDHVSNFRNQNSDSRIHRSWGETAMLKQAVHYACPGLDRLCMEILYDAGDSHLGGTLWHPFDHQRGGSPHPFYGGIMDAWRLPKLSYYEFVAQRPAEVNPLLPCKSGPMVYIANLMSPFSPSKVTVYSNCDEIRLTAYTNGKKYGYYRSQSKLKMPSPVIEFEHVFNFTDLETRILHKKRDDLRLVAEGLQKGKVVATYTRYPSQRIEGLQLRLDRPDDVLQANGSDIVEVVAEIVDEYGVVKRLNNSKIRFSISGEGTLLNKSSLGTNPMPAQWGEAPALIQATVNPGKIIVQAEIIGIGHDLVPPVQLEIQTLPSTQTLVYDKEAYKNSQKIDDEDKALLKVDQTNKYKEENRRLKQKIAAYEREKMVKQQEDFSNMNEYK